QKTSGPPNDCAFGRAFGAGSVMGPWLPAFPRRSSRCAPCAPQSRPGGPMTHDHWTEVKVAREATLAPPEQAAAKLASQNKLYVRDRIALLVDEGSFVEDAQLANALNPGLPADGVVTGRALVDGRPALIVANDPTVKAGSWGARPVEKIVRITE